MNSFTVSVTDGIETATATLNITVAAASNPDANGNGILDTWEIAKFGNADPGSNPPDADPDGDGLTNLMEYALDTEPLVGNPSPLQYDFHTLADGQHLRLTMPKKTCGHQS